jgi:short-subunit dehydrogenase
MDFKHKVVWITGASSGLGEAMAKLFNNYGANLILSSRNIDELKRVQSELLNIEAKSVIIPLDLRLYDTFEELTQKAVNAFGTIDILINNGGISQRSLAMDTPFSEELRLLEIDLVGTIALTKAVLPVIVDKKGQVVVMSSVMGKINTKYRTSYAAAKHGLVGYFESLRLELADEGVNICLIMPGFIATNITKNSLGTTPELIRTSQNNKGLSPEKFAVKALNAIYRRKGNVYIGGFKEGAAMIIKRISPALFDYFIKNQKVT